MSSENPRVYVRCLACYNENKLTGEWIDVDDLLPEEIQDLLKKCRHEEYAIHDYENFHGLTFSEHPNIENLIEIAECIEEHGQAFAEYVSWVGKEYATKDGFEESYQGEHDSAEDFAADLIEQTHDIKAMGNLANYIDYEKFARDLGYDGYYFADSPSGVFVFSPT